MGLRRIMSQQPGREKPGGDEMILVVIDLIRFLDFAASEARRGPALTAARGRRLNLEAQCWLVRARSVDEWRRLWLHYASKVPASGGRLAQVLRQAFVSRRLSRSTRLPAQ
jgi:hypothetical protein